MNGEEVAEVDFFVSYTAVDEAWARWIAITLEAHGYTTRSQALDFRPGNDFVHEMDRAVASARRTVAVWSPAYSQSRFGESEWRPAFAADASGELGQLIPVRVQPGRPIGLLRTRVAIDLVDVDEATARQRLIDGVAEPGPRPTSAPFPGEMTPARFPGNGAAVSNLPPRNRSFTGRIALLDDLRTRLQAATIAAVLPMEAIHGLGGVGKTELATEFAYRFATDYDITWWIPAQQPSLAIDALAALAARLHVPMNGLSAVAEKLFTELRTRDRWLLIYDNAERPRDIADLLPPNGVGSVLITSRWTAWGQRIESLRVDVLDRDESVELLSSRTGFESPEQLAQLADLLGDLPLALEEASAYLLQTGASLPAYIELVEQRARELFELDPASWSTTETADQQRIATIWSVTLDKIRGETPTAEAILTLFSFLSTEIPRWLPLMLPVGEMASAVSALPDAVTDTLRYNAALAALLRYSMIELGPESVGIHRLVQAVLRAQLSDESEREWASVATGLIRVAFPGNSGDAEQWEKCGVLLPHLMEACSHAEELEVAQENASFLLDRASLYLRSRGQYKQALPLAERAVKLAEAAFGSDHLEVASRRDELASVLVRMRNYPQAHTQAKRALQIAERSAGEGELVTAGFHNSLGSVLHEAGNAKRALYHHRRAAEIWESVDEPSAYDVAVVHTNIGVDLLSLGEWADARGELELAVQLGEEVFGASRLEVAVSHNNLAGVLRKSARPEDFNDALRHLERALEISQGLLEPSHPEIGLQYLNIGTLLQSLGRTVEARRALSSALQISEASLEADDLQMQKVREAIRNLP